MRSTAERQNTAIIHFLVVPPIVFISFSSFWPGVAAWAIFGHLAWSFQSLPAPFCIKVESKGKSFIRPNIKANLLTFQL